ncbi:Uma2 family endonuclease [Roseofilum casamattae]|uniref:Uma2 family endonuclease n=1 Tax=Roseofilum casamattae BLCC-M143 TaxID=3022442 RepID=A0ABT7BU96_9CYAN|nr:Uma2 family endonuclease [Roseofilum casamattae]MDJ1182347.1 Uma2 family endonuclease [Roseofilum casamattae BLCC-M143]
MTSLPQLQLEEVEYPSSDGEPMAESDITREFMIDSVRSLQAYFQQRSDVYVSANSFIYYEQGNNKACISPDVYVVFGVRNRKRESYKVWREGGITPDFVLEVTSETTQEKDQGIKPNIYRQLEVKEYFQYDPSGHYLNPILQGLRLVDGEYEPIVGESVSASDISLYSKTLGLELCLVYGDLRFRNPQTGELLENRQEVEQRRREAELGRREAELALTESERSLSRLQQSLTEAERTLANTARQLLSSGFEIERVAQLMQLSVEQVRLLVD